MEEANEQRENEVPNWVRLILKVARTRTTRENKR